MPGACATVLTFENVLLWGAEDDLAELLKGNRIVRNCDLVRGQKIVLQVPIFLVIIEKICCLPRFLPPNTSRGNENCCFLESSQGGRTQRSEVYGDITQFHKIAAISMVESIGTIAQIRCVGLTCLDPLRAGRTLADLSKESEQFPRPKVLLLSRRPSGNCLLQCQSRRRQITSNGTVHWMRPRNSIGSVAIVEDLWTFGNRWGWEQYTLWII